jgi:hypothetical protein
MRIHTLKSVVQRGSMFGAVFALAIATVLPAASVYADALNPLTERSLMLSSSAPGYVDTDGSGNTVDLPDASGNNYAPAGSGPNGKKTGETFTFNVSSTAAVKAFTLQYCTEAAGKCQAPGNNDGDARPAEDDREDNADAWPDKQSDLDVVGTWANGSGPGEFEILKNTTPELPGTWSMEAINAEDDSHSEALSGKNNMIRLTTSGSSSLTNGDTVQIKFRASDSTYITNPGLGSFFVKINTYSTDELTNLIPDIAAADNSFIIDGGVTVANVMTDSIHITTKVLETMSFSVGTKNRDTVTVACAVDPDFPDCEGLTADHGKCYPIQSPNNNRLDLGNSNAEFSLETDRGYSVYSYWRLSSNSSGGATVYYSGNTLANTVGDEIKEMANETTSTPGTEQFGLGFVDASLDPVGTDFVGPHPDSYPFRTVAGDDPQDENLDPKWDIDELPVQTTSQAYDQATGTLDDGNRGPGSAQFKFKKSSLTVPEPIAKQNDRVISCATAKMRYVANIGADTPAGVYTTKINYLAAPQY